MNKTFTELDFQVASPAEENWQDEFRLFLERDYRKVSPIHRQPAEKSIKAAMQHVRVFGMWWEATFNETFEPVKITNYALRLWQRHSLDEARVAPSTWNGRFWALGIFTGWIERTNGVAFADLMDGLEMKNEGFRVKKYRSLTRKEIHDVMQRLERDVRAIHASGLEFPYAQALRNQTMITFMIGTGLRVSEVSALKWSDLEINLRSGTVRVLHGKGDKERQVPLNLEVRAALSAWREYSEHSGNSSTNVWMGKATESISSRTIERTIQDIFTSVSIEDVTPHWLRYTFAKLLETKGIPIAKICEFLGHNDPKTTTIYLASGAEESQSAVEGMM